MKIALIFVLIAILGYGTGLVVEVIAEGDDSKLQRLADTGQFDPSWIPFLLNADLYKFNNLIGSLSLEFLDIPKFIQIGQLLVQEQAPIDHANVAFDIEVIKVIDEGKTSLQNVVSECIFHSPDDFTPLCIICKVLDAGGNVIGKGAITDPTMSYTGSTTIPIPLSPVPEPYLEMEPELTMDYILHLEKVDKMLQSSVQTIEGGLPAPQTNDVQDVEGVRLILCEFNEGCTPGFWQTHSEFGPAHFNAWPTTGFMTGEFYLDVFGIRTEGEAAGFEIKVEKEKFDDPTLFLATQAEGGYFNAFARHSTAALLNAGSDLVDYALTVPQVIALVQNLATAGDLTDRQAVEALKDFFEAQNELLCEIGADSIGVELNPEFEEEPEEEGGQGKGGKKK